MIPPRPQKKKKIKKKQKITDRKEEKNHRLNNS